MQNPFNHENYPSNELKRNTFPCSFQYNGTFRYGYIYPAGIWRTVPGASYKIQPTLGLNFMPTVFPVQTRQRVYVHYFYGRDRNFWSDYKDFVNGQKSNLVKPYIDEGITKARTGSLLDYMGVPTTIVGDYGTLAPSSSVYLDTTKQAVRLYSSIEFHDGEDYDSEFYDSILNDSAELDRVSEFNQNQYVYAIPIVNAHSVSRFVLEISYNGSSEFLTAARPLSLNGGSYESPSPRSMSSFATWMRVVEVSSSGIIQNVFDAEVNESHLSFDVNVQSDSRYYLFTPLIILANYSNETSYHRLELDKLHSIIYQGSNEVRDIDDETSPYWRSNDSRGKSTLKLGAILPRMYETIYNLYYRNPQNNPYILDGQPEYNKYIPSKDGGLDSNKYQLRRRNWEDDFLTTAVQSPQQGIAPLVGLTDRSATITITNDDGTVTRYITQVNADGSLSNLEATGSSDPQMTKALVDAVSYGISIEDIRNVNAMQKWLELNLRKGYQYKDIIQARWGISISYNELDLPEFIGGFAKDVELQAVTQTANIDDSITGQLGWQSGRCYASGEGREITHYCDEEGYIMCLICVVPVPNYSQLLPKHWIDRDLLDGYQPEFNHIGFQPITYKEVCPVQAFQESTQNVNVLEQTFGYQRPWYQYFNYTDEVHGQFRTTFKDYLINRVFNVKPELSESFLLVDPEQINDVFNVTEDDDKIIGAIYHNCTAKLPISMYAQARLE